MEPASTKMEAGPPKVIERIVGLLIPPTRREHVLGDLCERYRSPQQYIMDAVRTVPFVIASQIRRTFNSRLVLSEAIALCLSFVSATSWFAGTGLLRLAIPVVIALVTLVLRDAYADPNRQSPQHSALDAVLGVGIAFLSQLALSVVSLDLVLPRSVMLIGGGLSVVLLSALRLAFRSQRTMRPVDDVHLSSEALQKRAWRTNLAWLVAVIVVHTITLPTTAYKIAVHAIFATFLLGWYLRHRQGFATIAQDFAAVTIARDRRRIQLERRRDSFESWSGPVALILLCWLAFPLLIAVLLAWNSVPPANWGRVPTYFIMFAALLLYFFLFVRKLNERATRALQEEIDALGAAERQQ